MQEALIHYIWQHQYFEKSELKTNAHEILNIIRPGMPNTLSGPDFKEAKIKINGLEWQGSVEIHIKSSDWNNHKHNHDAAYDNVILHVVWEHDKEVYRSDGTKMPTLELRDLVDKKLLLNYQNLMNGSDKIPCEQHLPKVDHLTILSTLDKALLDRLYTKASFIKDLYCENNNDWEETTYQLLAKNFGFKINSEAFLQLSQATPFKIIKKHAHSLHQLEALLFGQSTLMNEVSFDDEKYASSLMKEHEFLKHKYTLTTSLTPSQWKFMRLRPAGFPTVRIAQFAAIMQQASNLFDALISINDIKQLESMMRKEISPHWQCHFTFEKTARDAVPVIGIASTENIAINTVAPLLVAYGKTIDSQQHIDKAINLLQSIKAEDNKIIRLWEEMKVKVTSAADSQALIQLYNEYCVKKRCLSCTVGNTLVKR